MGDGNMQIDYAIHPVAELFPLMSDEEYEGLKDDIRENGQRERIVLWCDKIIDGRNRLRACVELGFTPEYQTLCDASDPLKYVISHNLHRRHLKEGQRAMVAAGIANLKRGDNQHKNEDRSIDLSSQKEAASLLNVSVPSVKRAKAVKENGTPELAEMVRDGKVSVNAASKVAMKPKAEQKKIVSKGAEAVKEAATTVPKKLPKAKPLPKTVMSKSPQELAASIHAAGESLLRLIDEMDRLSDQVGGEWIDMQEVETRASSLRKLIRGFAHWVDCPECIGKGCGSCKKRGWLCADRKQFLDQRQKDLLGVA
jgi:hypothetical protein